MDTGEGSQS